MKVLGLICKCCDVFIFSRARHDFKTCPCEECFVDGGQRNTYMRYGKTNGSNLAWVEIKQTMEQLYSDWNEQKDKYGMIKVNKAKFTTPPENLAVETKKKGE